MVPSMNVFLVSGIAAILAHSAGACVCTGSLSGRNTPASAKSFTWRWVRRMMSGSWAVPSSSCTLALKSPPGIASILRSMLLCSRIAWYTGASGSIGDDGCSDRM